MGGNETKVKRHEMLENKEEKKKYDENKQSNEREEKKMKQNKLTISFLLAIKWNLFWLFLYLSLQNSSNSRS